MEIGFTGTQQGMTLEQKQRVGRILKEIGPYKVHHGMCVGADKNFHDISRRQGLYIVGHPGVTKDGRVWQRADCDVDEIEPEIPFLERNQIIVDMIDVLIATPGEFEEQLRSGTWSTIRKAHKAHKKTIIIFPDGSVTEDY